MLMYIWELLEMLPSARELAAHGATVFRREKRRRAAGLGAALTIALQELLLLWASSQQEVKTRSSSYFCNSYLWANLPKIRDFPSDDFDDSKHWTNIPAPPPPLLSYWWLILSLFPYILYLGFYFGNGQSGQSETWNPLLWLEKQLWKSVNAFED